MEYPADVRRPSHLQLVAPSRRRRDLEPPHAVVVAGQAHCLRACVVADNAFDLGRFAVRFQRLEVDARRQPRHQVATLREEVQVQFRQQDGDAPRDGLGDAALLDLERQERVLGLDRVRQVEGDQQTTVVTRLQLDTFHLTPVDLDDPKNGLAGERLAGALPELRLGFNPVARAVGLAKHTQFLLDHGGLVGADDHGTLLGRAADALDLQHILPAGNALRHDDVAFAQALFHLHVLVHDRGPTGVEQLAVVTDRPFEGCESRGLQQRHLEPDRLAGLEQRFVELDVDAPGRMRVEPVLQLVGNGVSPPAPYVPPGPTFLCVNPRTGEPQSCQSQRPRYQQLPGETPQPDVPVWVCHIGVHAAVLLPRVTCLTRVSTM